MNHLERCRIMSLLDDVYCEWVEDLGIPPEQILLTLLEKEREKNIYLEKRIESLQYAKKNLD